MRTLFEEFRNLNNYQINVIVFLSQMKISYVSGNATFSEVDANVMFLLKNTVNSDFQITILSYGGKHNPFKEVLSRL